MAHRVAINACKKCITTLHPLASRTSKSTISIKCHYLLPSQKTNHKCNVRYYTREGDGEEDKDCSPAEWDNPYDNRWDGRITADEFGPGEEMPVVPLPPFDTEDGKTQYPPHIEEISEMVLSLNLREAFQLATMVKNCFGLEEFEGAEADDSGDSAEQEEEVKQEKSLFELKLTGFDDKSKIKVIKEVRAITSLGLKEAKEMVEGAPKIVKKDIKKEEAEELKKKLEAVGATVEIV